jgi:hypothetical protein
VIEKKNLEGKVYAGWDLSVFLEGLSKITKLFDVTLYHLSRSKFEPGTSRIQAGSIIISIKSHDVQFQCTNNKNKLAL